MSKVNVSEIVVAHFKTLRDDATNQTSITDISLFIGAPAIIGGIAALMNWALYIDALNALLAAFAIFAGLLLNLLLLVFTFSSDSVHPVALARTRTILLRELHNNIAFSVLLSIIIVVVALGEIAILRIKSPDQSIHTGPVGTFTLIFLTANFVLTLLMILRRIYAVFNSQLERPAIKKAS